MLADIMRRLAGRPEDDGVLPGGDQRIAVAALLVIAAHADHDYAEVERTQIEHVLGATLSAFRTCRRCASP
ncbi:Tellurite resistance protein TerB [Terricaulis silvestris]|uniref:Tellurite resistance protein TerB n=1 Tax=Terricaulis silvestris TaxID=2686094 RepID=A0A6I6MWW7_9CAUL|nr:Tellurite resistance protein TerB [Terricaulis silvestris]